MAKINESSSLSDYAKTEQEELEEFAEFSPKYQAFRIYRTCLHLQSNQQYSRARKTFYDTLGWFTVMFDATFPTRCYDIIHRYEDPKYNDEYTYEQVEQIKYMRITAEFSRMLIDASSKNKVKLNTNPDKRVELIPVGYSQVLNYEHMAVEFANRLMQVQQQQSHRDVVKFFNHAMGWFGGIFDAKFLIQGYIIEHANIHPEAKYRKMVSAFSKLLTRKSITPTAFATLVYKPRPGSGYPITKEDVIKAKSAKPAEIMAANDEATKTMPAKQMTQSKQPQQSALSNAIKSEQLAAIMRASKKMNDDKMKKQGDEKPDKDIPPAKTARAPDGGTLLTVDDVVDWNERNMNKDVEDDDLDIEDDEE